MTIAVDAMGGDHGPQVIVDAVGMIPPAERDVLLVGQPEAVAACMREDLGVEIVPAPEVVEMHESPAVAVRQKKRSSLAIAADLVRCGRAKAFLSAGNTGATMAFGMFVLGRLPGVSRPAIAVTLPSLTGHFLLLDVGANVDCRPEHLCDFALMGSAYYAAAMQCPQPRVGLLSIGTERSKGNELIFSTHKRLEQLPGICYVGNVEGADMTEGRVDVVVCDGFVGNSVLKFGEAVAEMIFCVLDSELHAAGTPDAKVNEILRRTARRTDWAEYGGALLLGLTGGCIICHGRSSARALRNAIRLAQQTDFERLNQAIIRSLAAAGAAERGETCQPSPA